MNFASESIPNAPFGSQIEVPVHRGAALFIDYCRTNSTFLLKELDKAKGLLLIHGMGEVANKPDWLLELSQLCGNEVENYRETNIAQHLVHTEIPQILQVSNVAPVSRQPPGKPEPPLTEDGLLPVTFPHRVGWHSDQSYRRPPPDVSLFYAVKPCPQGQGQTLYASGILAYDALSDEQKNRIGSLRAIHAQPRTGYSEAEALSEAEEPKLAAHKLPQPQPLVRTHPVTGERALFLCERNQTDWFNGPFEGLEPGPHGEGAKLLYELMEHYTQRKFVYIHEWDEGDLIIYDNRTTIHSATWFDSVAHPRVMWRTTVSGNAGPEYAGERKSWIAA